ncbi:MAG TPA: HD domain-containing response regulator [Candidatus Methylomirabilis sp.]|nr:HD domain-containing response regulator [Candidatus Methylomirabilis sp.]
MRPSESIPPPGQQRTVLVVDDDESSRTYLAEALEALGCRVLQAADGGEALRLLAEATPDLVCTDLMMPGMDGLEFLQLAQIHAPGLPLILVTACDQAEVSAEAMRSGAAAFLRKPVSLADLTGILERIPPPGGAGVCRPTPPSEGGSSQVQESPAGSGGLDPALLRKTTQLSLLTRFGTVLRQVDAGAAGESGGNGRPPTEPSGTHAIGIPADSGLAPLVSRSLSYILRAMPGERAALALTDGPEPQPILACGRAGPPLPLGILASGLAEGGDGHPWHGTLEGTPLVAAPLTIQGAAVGFICVGRSRGAATFTFADGELLAAFSAQTATLLENACFGRQLEQALQDTVASLVVTLEARDKYTEGHSLRVARYATGIAETLALTPGLCHQVSTAGLLHDLGKVGVRDAILDKPGRLTPEEWAVMRQHPVVGSKILAPLGFLAEEARSVRHHHERFDGAGYPDGLAGEAIPLPARIIAVADTFDAMSTARPYRPPLPVTEALAELDRAAGTQFDPRIVSAFLAWHETHSTGGGPA